MNTSLTLRYAIELAMVIPAAVIAILPVYYSRKVKKAFLFGLMGILLAATVIGGAVLCSVFGITSNTFIFPALVLMTNECVPAAAPFFALTAITASFSLSAIPDNTNLLSFPEQTKSSS